MSSKKQKAPIKVKNPTKSPKPTAGPPIKESNIPPPSRQPTQGTAPKESRPPVSDCGWGGVSNPRTNNRGGRRGR